MQAINAVYEIYSFITTNWVQIGVAVGGVISAARVIVMLTPSDSDNQALNAVVAWLKTIGLHIEN
jgi:hypothetical protein